MMNAYIEQLIANVIDKHPYEPEFHQAVGEVARSLEVVIGRDPKYREARILDRMVEPERVIMFRVAWVDDQGRSASTAGTGSR
jgi:glutamate dehydrogenase (NADP+)